MSYPPGAHRGYANPFEAGPGGMAASQSRPSVAAAQSQPYAYSSPGYAPSPHVQAPPHAQYATSPRPPNAPSASAYSLPHDQDDAEKDDYYGVPGDDHDHDAYYADRDDVPLTPHLRQQHEQQAAAAGYGNGSYAGGFADPHYRPAGVAGTLNRRQTTAEAWKRRQQLGRAQTKKVQLGKRGNLIAEYKVPTAVHNANKLVVDRLAVNDHPEEFTHMRYTAATCDPDDFTADNGWSLRASTYGRSTDLLIAITYYNENKFLVARTLHSVMENVRDMVRNKYSEFRRAGAGKAEAGAATGNESWKRVVVSLIFDGIDPADPNVLDVLACLGVYQDAVVKGAVNDKPTVAHIFEYTTAISFSPKNCALVIPSPDDPHGLVPTQFIFCLKQKNAKKINSHRWLFNGLAHHLQPDVCILLDAGTKPSPNSLYYLWEAFYHKPTLGGACGEIHAMLAGGKKLLNPLVAAQNFEYKMSNILDKPTESSFGYVSVLPGAFSAYRFRAIQGRPLQQYFHGDHSLAERLGPKGIMGMSIFKKNMFLAEDRILCWELVASRRKKYKLAFVRAAKGETDVPESAVELIGQRRRWLNGSFAATIYSIINFWPAILLTRHNPLRMLAFHLQLIYSIVVLIFTWFNIAFWWLTYAILIRLLPEDSGIYLFGSAASTWYVNTFSTWLFTLTIGLQFLLAIGAKPKTERPLYTLSLVIFAVLGFYLLVCALILTVRAFQAIDFGGSAGGGGILDRLRAVVTGTAGVLLAALVSTVGAYLIASLLYLDVAHMLHSFIQFLALAPSFILILQVFAFSNISDVSWGTKGADRADALPAVKSSKTAGNVKVVDELERTQEDLERTFRATALRAISKHKPKEEVYKPSEDDQNRKFRTSLLLVWLLSNLAVIASIEYIGGYEPDKDTVRKRQSIFFQVVLWATFGLTVVKLAGSFYFWLTHEILRSALLCFRGT